MKILITASTLPRWKNDIQPSFVLDFANELSKQHEVYILAPYDKGSKFKEVINKVTIYRFPYFFPGFERLAYRGGMVNSFTESWTAKIQLPIFLLMEFLYTLYLAIFKKVDVINAHWLFPQGFVTKYVKIITHKKSVLTTHGGDVAILQDKLKAKLLAPILHNFDYVTFVSNKNLDDALKVANMKKNDKYLVLPMGISLPKLSSTKLNQEAINILFIGRLVKIKGVDVLIKAINNLGTLGQNVNLIIAGDGPLNAQLNDLTRRLGLTNKVQFTGFVSGATKQELFKNAAIVVIPSIRDERGYEEGLPVAALEAMSYGKVLIATRTGSLPELIDNKNGMLVEPNDDKALCDTIKFALKSQSSWPSISHSARLTAGNYSWSKISSRFSKIILGGVVS
jgi:glycosyltransferase involved in cell wall biosynthesis